MRFIDAKELKRTIVSMYHRDKEYSEADESINFIVDAICDDIDNTNGIKIYRYYCQCCGTEYHASEPIIGFLPQCPNCGARMIKEK